MRCWLVRAALYASGMIAISGGMIGCGTTKEYNATQQLVMSDAVDRSISSLDFRPLTGRKVYLDTSYLRQVKGEGFVNAEYVTSAMRQQIVGAGCLIQDASTDAEIIIEARIGTLGLDDHAVTFGIPENNVLSTAAGLVPGAPQVASLPEIALGRREAREAAVKVAAFAYDRETRAAVWQSGVRPANATARDTWVMGIGPFQGGSIRRQTKLAGSGLRFGEQSSTGSPGRFYDRPPVDYTAETRFQEGWPVFNDGGLSADMIGVSPEAAGDDSDVPQIATVSGEEAVDGEAKPAAADGGADASETKPAKPAGKNGGKRMVR
ncbi:hypothetical protein K227x_29100 [Rubripirellula lacrimiformis]|uniref:Uncharacterized protein n=2 Tax=Rubripirellula lacrimiformis TaxID=1930273 RepID=A0A517NBY3_9BACT|nr:hypothetical protein K227x_29100 [Rubripirellula lacrimiformis]